MRAYFLLPIGVFCGPLKNWKDIALVVSKMVFHNTLLLQTMQTGLRPNNFIFTKQETCSYLLLMGEMHAGEVCVTPPFWEVLFAKTQLP